MQRVKQCLNFMMVVLICLICPLASSGQEEYDFVLSWPDGPGFRSPWGVAVDSLGNVYIVEYENHRVQKLSSEGIVIKAWGAIPFGDDDGQFCFPHGIAIDSLNNVYIADTDNKRIQKFTSDGNFLTKWRVPGPEGDTFRPRGIAIDSSGNVYVTNVQATGNAVYKFASDGTLLTKWGTQGEGIGHFQYPNYIAVDDSGYIYVTDYGKNSIQKFNSNGVFVVEWSSGSDGIVIDPIGIVYVSDSDNYCVQKFTSDGIFLDQWEIQRDTNEQAGPTGISIDNVSGNVYVAHWGYNSVYKFTSDGVLLTKWGTCGDGDGQFHLPALIDTDTSGNVYVSDWVNHRILKFTSEGDFLNKWGKEGTDDGQFCWPWGVAVDNLGNIYVAERCNNRVQKLTSDGAYLTKWGAWGYDDGQFFWPRGIAVDNSGNVYVADLGNCRVQKFTSDGVFLAKWGTCGEADGQFISPVAVAAGNSGYVYVADKYSNRVQKFTSDGLFLGKWGEYGFNNGQFGSNSPRGIAVDSSGNVYVTDWGNNRVQKFTHDGVFIAKWGMPGNWSIFTESRYPVGIAVDLSGDVYVADTGNICIRVYRPADIKQPNLTPSAQYHDFGSVIIGKQNNWNLVISNTGSADLAITSIASNDSVLEVISPIVFPQNITPGNNIDVTVRFSPVEEKVYSTNLTILSNDPDKPSLDIRIDGIGITIVADSFIWPVLGESISHPLNNAEDPRQDGWYVTNAFGNSCPECSGDPVFQYHSGEDWNLVACPTCDQDEPVHAIADGEIIRSTDMGSALGWAVIIKHKLPQTFDITDYILSGTSLPISQAKSTDNIVSAYMHLNAPVFGVVDVYAGDSPIPISKGAVVSTIYPCIGGSHLHFEIRYWINLLKSTRTAEPGNHVNGYYDSWQDMTSFGYINPSTAGVSKTTFLENFCKSTTDLTIQTTCPVNIILTDPIGRSISKNASGIPSASYTETDIDGDGALDDRVIVDNPLAGDYSIQIVPEPEATPTDTYTLDVVYDGKFTRLVDDLEIQYIPTEPHVFSTDNKLSRDLDFGWHLISLPAQPLDTNTNSVFSSIQDKYVSVFSYKPNSEWLRYFPDFSQFSNLWQAESGIGYWISIEYPGTLTISEWEQPETAIELEVGWNLVGYCSQTMRDVEQCMSSINGSYNSVWEYNLDEGWRYYLPGIPELSSLQLMRPWHGYWIEASEQCIWDIAEE